MKNYVLLCAFIVIACACNQSRSNPGQPGNSSGSNTVAPREKTPEELRQELLELERNNPIDYLSDESTWRENLLGETVVEGTITNSATMAEFKDVVLEITWLSKTDTELGSTTETVYEFVGPGKSVSFKLKFYAPTDTKGIRVNVINATSTN